MFGIGHLLKRVQNRQTREFFVREIIRTTLKEVAGVDVIVENTKLKDGVATILNLSNSARSEVYMKKQKILKLVNERQDVLVVTNLQ